jgi:hypothetical protein
LRACEQQLRELYPLLKSHAKAQRRKEERKEIQITSLGVFPLRLCAFA